MNTNQKPLNRQAGVAHDRVSFFITRARPRIAKEKATQAARSNTSTVVQSLSATLLPGAPGVPDFPRTK